MRSNNNQAAVNLTTVLVLAIAANVVLALLQAVNLWRISMISFNQTTQATTEMVRQAEQVKDEKCDELCLLSKEISEHCPEVSPIDFTDKQLLANLGQEAVLKAVGRVPAARAEFAKMACEAIKMIQSSLGNITESIK
jgi:hypothetical protein